MKHKLSVTMDEELVLGIFKALSSGKFRNKSHVVEYAVRKLLEDSSSATGKIITPTSPQTHHEEQDG